MTISMALRAQPRPRDLQHGLVDRAVGFMTVQAVGANRRVFEQERSALFGMTLVASVVDRGRPQQNFIRGAVRLMAIGAGHVADFVDAAAPIGAVALFVAGKTNGVVFLNAARQVFGPERNDAADAATAAQLHMLRTRAMAVLARELAGLVLADPSHQGLRERFGMAGVTGHANLLADEVCFNRWTGRPAPDGRRRCRRWRAVAAQEFLHRVNRVVGLGQLHAGFARDRPLGADAPCEFIELGVDRVVGLTGRCYL